MTNLDAAFDLLDAYSALRKAARRFDLAGDPEMAEDTRKAAEAVMLMAKVAEKRHKEAAGV
jgi:hypothetical protein